MLIHASLVDALELLFPISWSKLLMAYVGFFHLFSFIKAAFAHEHASSGRIPKSEIAMS